jgi:DNA-binding Lrp family transcriptional regulator
VLDSFDRAILDLLQRDNTLPQREIAEAVHLSTPAVQRRIKRLQDSGVIAANVAVVAAAKVGPLTIIVEVRVVSEQRERVAPFKRRVQDDPAVQQCYSITGDGDFLLLLSAASMEEYEAITERLFGGDDNIERFRTSVALGTLKRSFEVPLLPRRARLLDCCEPQVEPARLKTMSTVLPAHRLRRWLLRGLWLAIAIVAAMTLWNSPWAAAPKMLWASRGCRRPPTTGAGGRHAPARSPIPSARHAAVTARTPASTSSPGAARQCAAPRPVSSRMSANAGSAGARSG